VTRVRSAARGVGGSAILLGLVVAACSGGPSGPAASAAPSGGAGGPVVVAVTLTDAGCVPDTSSVTAGAVTFRVANDGGDAVSEVELMEGDRILGEKENLAPGLTGTFTLELQPGDYVLACPGATTPETTFTVTPAASVATSSVTDTSLEEATDAYAAYVRDEVGQLVTATGAFTDAVIAGDVERAKALYGPARVFYERIEPVAERFGDLDPAIDGRADDAASPAEFTGFHRLEQALWETGDVTGMTPIAERLVADIGRLRDLVATETYQPAQLANGAAELLDEIAASKITGEEERYSHLDLLDFEANLEGARAAYDLLRPALTSAAPDLAASLDERFAAVEADLGRYRSGDGFVTYTALTADQTRALAQGVDALAEPLSEVAARLVGS